jgi:hypothetical protein
MTKIQKMTVWQTRSGRLHLRWQCTGSGPKSLQRKVRVTREQFDAAERCRCLRDWRAEP